MYDAIGLFCNQINTRLIINISYILPHYSLFGIFFLLQLEYMLIKIELQRLIGIVNAQLLKAIGANKILKTKYVQYGYRICCRCCIIISIYICILSLCRYYVDIIFLLLFIATTTTTTTNATNDSVNSLD
jgi:hypothetical protein